jgi:hypothetical protein
MTITRDWLAGGAGAGGAAVNVVTSFWKVTPRITGATAVPPARSIGRTASSRVAMKAGDGSATVNAAAAKGSFGRAVKPAGSMVRASRSKAA